MLISSRNAFLALCAATVVAIISPAVQADVCHVCGKGRVMGNPDGIPLAGTSNTTCAQIQEFGNAGILCDDSCDYFQQLASEPCQCKDAVESSFVAQERTSSLSSPTCNLCGKPGWDVQVGGPNDHSVCASLRQAAQASNIPAEVCADLQQRVASESCKCSEMESSIVAPEQELDTTRARESPKLEATRVLKPTEMSSCNVCGSPNLELVASDDDFACKSVHIAAAIRNITTVVCDNIQLYVKRMKCECREIIVESPGFSEQEIEEPAPVDSPPPDSVAVSAVEDTSPVVAPAPSAVIAVDGPVPVATLQADATRSACALCSTPGWDIVVTDDTSVCAGIRQASTAPNIPAQACGQLKEYVSAMSCKCQPVTGGPHAVQSLESPSDYPSMVPSDAPSDVPTSVLIAAAPSDYPSMVPSDAPSLLLMSDAPSLLPSDAPSLQPSDVPSVVPTEEPTLVLNAAIFDKNDVAPAPSGPCQLCAEPGWDIVAGDELSICNSIKHAATAANTPAESCKQLQQYVSVMNCKCQAPGDDLQSSPSDYPSMVPSDVPSSIPSDVPSLSPSDMPSLVPSAAPTLVEPTTPTTTTTDTDAYPVCNLCGEGADLTFPDGVPIVIAGATGTTCSIWQARGNEGQIPESICEELQHLSQGACGCVIASDKAVPAPVAGGVVIGAPACIPLLGFCELGGNDKCCDEGVACMGGICIYDRSVLNTDTDKDPDSDSKLYDGSQEVGRGSLRRRIKGNNYMEQDLPLTAAAATSNRTSPKQQLQQPYSNTGTLTAAQIEELRSSLRRRLGP